MSNITQEQVLKLEASPRFQNVSKQYVRDRASYLLGQDGNAGNLAGLIPKEWAKQRFIGAGITLHPNSQDYQSWTSQFTMFLKGQDVWVAPPSPLLEGVTEVDATIDAMLASGKFDELSELTYALRATVIEF